MTIQVLPEMVVARIAAGEAIERPASAVKELIENAIDAGAGSIHVEAEQGGRRLLRVTDNGCGIRGDEIELAFRRHATSKLRLADELPRLRTLGFRGEALASIAAVSQTTVVSRQRDESGGVSLRLLAGAIQHRRGLGAPAGTAVTVENLFFNTPARLKFLKSVATEKRHIHWVVARYAMAYPGIAFALKQEGRERFRSSGSGALADVVAKAYGLQEFKSMTAIRSQETGSAGGRAIEVEGYASLPPLSRANRERIILFVNGRAVNDSALTRAVTSAYEGLLKAGAFPLAALRITTPPEFVDVNVHPTKAQVRFRDPGQAFLAVQRAVRGALHESEASPPESDIWSSSGFSDEYIPYQRPQPAWRRPGGDELFDADGLESLPAVAEAPASPRTLPVLRVVGQAGAAYIIAEGPAGLYLVDQNAAHERLLYHELLAQRSNGGIHSRGLAEGAAALLSPEDANLLEARARQFSGLGFEIEVFGPNTFMIRRAPALLAGQDADAYLPGLLASLRGQGDSAADELAALAAVAALRSGQILEQEEMRSLVAQLERCPEPHYSPSGRKTLIHISREQLAQEFRRS